MIFSKTKDKSFKHELKGDQLRAKKQHRKALESYEKALEIDDTRVALYDKLIDALDEMKDKWTEEDFASSVLWSMKKQELLDPTFKRVHARAEPEFQEVSKLIKRMLSAKTPVEETELVEDIRAYGEFAVYPLVDFLMTFKEIGTKSKALKEKLQKK